MFEANTQIEHDAIVAVIENECEAFYRREFERWASYWLHDESVRRLGTLAGGYLEYQRGWEAEAAMMARVMRDHPNPNETAATMVRRENMNIRICGDMAWASFDQYTPRTEDVFINAGLSYQVRIFEKHDGEWKIAFLGFGDTRTEYFNFPTICIDHKGSVLWVNAAAQTRLPDHPVLMVSAGILRARSRKHEGILQAVTKSIDGLTPLDVRSSFAQEQGSRSAKPLVLDDPHDDISHILWISKVDGMILVSFNDSLSEEERLKAAQNLYGLSEAQMRLAKIIVEGRGLAQAAEQLSVSVNTVRTHLQRMFDKTGVRSQTALVRVLLSSQAPTN